MLHLGCEARKSAKSNPLHDLAARHSPLPLCHGRTFRERAESILHRGARFPLPAPVPGLNMAPRTRERRSTVEDCLAMTHRHSTRRLPDDQLDADMYHCTYVFRIYSADLLTGGPALGFDLTHPDLDARS